jgi:pimeloyl-ACP methyl ester carboxylesterase
MTSTLLFTFLLAFSAPGFAAAPSTNPYTITVAPVERFESGVLAVEKHGSRGRPLILVPGLASGAWAWQSVIRDLSADYTIYVVTLPGFDSRPFPAGAGFAAARAGLRDLVDKLKLDRPVLIGHSMGAALGLAAAADMPQAVGGVVALDGLPVFPGTDTMAPAERPAMAADARIRMAVSDPAAFATQQQAYMRTGGVRDMAQANQLAQLSSRSDPAAVSQYVAEVLALDLRPDLGKITAPILVLAPYFDQDPMDARWTPEAKVAYYRSLLGGAPSVQALPVMDARHFLMFDQPQKVNAMLRTYLQAL